MVYPPPMAAALSGASVGQLAYWRRERDDQPPLVAPEYGTRPRVLYSFRDVVALRLAVQLRKDTSLQRIRKAVAWLTATFPERHLSEHNLRVLRSTIIYISPEGDYVDVVAKPGQVGLSVVFESIFKAFEAPSGRTVPDLERPFPGVVIHPEIRGGYPVVERTRVPYSVVASLARDGLTPREIRQLYPGVTRKAVGGATRMADEVAHYARSAAAG